MVFGLLHVNASIWMLLRGGGTLPPPCHPLRPMRPLRPLRHLATPCHPLRPLCRLRTRCTRRTRCTTAPNIGRPVGSPLHAI